MLTTHLAGCEPLHGRRVSLLRSSPDHAEFLSRCYRNTDFMNLYRLAQNRNESLEQIRARLQKDLETPPQHLKRFEWVIHRRNADGTAGEAVGLCAVADFMPFHKRGEFLVGILEPEQRKAGLAGLALEASLLTLDFAFNRLRLHKLINYVYGHNAYANANSKELGFTEEGYLREHIYYTHYGYVDLFQNGMLETDFRANQRLARLSKRLLGHDITYKEPEAEQLSRAHIKQANIALQDYVQRLQAQQNQDD